MSLPNATVLYQPPNPAVIAAIDELGPPTASARAIAHQAGDIVFFGRLVFEKGVDRLIRAYALWRSSGSSSGLAAGRSLPRLIIHGSGPELAFLQSLIDELKVVDTVEIRPFLSGKDLTIAARGASVVVIPSLWEEPGATIAVELFACGVPVIASSTGAQGEIFAGHGLLAPGNDDPGLG